MLGVCYDRILYEEELKIVQSWAREIKYIRDLTREEEIFCKRLKKGLKDWRYE